MHMAVRAAATQTAKKSTVQQSQARFVVHMFQQLGQWAEMYFSAAWEAPLSLARDTGADIVACFELAG